MTASHQPPGAPPAGDPPQEEAPELPLLGEPADGIPEVIGTAEGLAAVAAELAAGTGPVAVDAERASGFRYGQRAFLVQLRREGTGTLLLDAEALGDLDLLQPHLAGAEWVLHSATQDLPCLAERGLVPGRLFDTEYAARLLGWERFGLGAVVERTLGVRLAKEHSAVDWSTRPLPEDWLRYAALDVEVLLAVRDVLAAELEAAGKTGWAEQEFAHLARFAPAVHDEPWRRVKGVGRLPARRHLAVARALWELRDDRAREADLAPGRLLSDRALLALATRPPGSARELRDIIARTDRRRVPGAEDAQRWYAAVQEASALPEEALPSRHPEAAPRSRRSQAERNQIKERLAALKEALRARAAALHMGAEILLSPAVVRELAGERRFASAAHVQEEAVAAYLRDHDARPWQIEQALAPVTEVLRRHAV
ncbi:HRDC domain-containing protein [Sediminivirga luteola]|uniref:3'-5' exonuclease n=1 Tax=Sediminivirga luteola TaxID=1774748 RepID=A0A8J2TWF5_9MICO|nr:HRDC domain-containing protein [Sediminivirga luteola]MCI2266201.1 HRDC domain-containing protein [Sediminivirga luteola]GGA08257.1 3'-5' exonuclease [Sediminivirga luteola]